MPDRLYLSCWVRGFKEKNMLQHFATMLSVFPFSKLAQRGPVLRTYALERIEPPVLEREFPKDTPPEELIEIASEVSGPDCCYEVDAAWDLWQYEKDWSLAPTIVTLVCSGPEFENEVGDHLRIEFGLDSRFLPVAGIEGSLRMGQSNLRSLIRLVNDVERVLPLEKRRLWSESGVNFADLLTETLSSFEPN